jgi:hypothetical protein
MRKSLLFVVMLLGLVVGWGTTVARAEDIVGLSLRPTDAMPGEKARGSVDIVRSPGGDDYVIKVDLSPAAESMDLAKFDDATVWVVWAVDMEGVRHNLGTLDDNLMLEDAAADFMVAKLYVTAEKEPDGSKPEGEPLFSVALRSVEEVDAPAQPGSKSAAADATGSPAATAMPGTAMATTAAGTPAATTAAIVDTAAAGAKAGDKPDKLPTTGDPVQDVLMLVLVAAALLFGGWRLRAVRL